MCVVHFLVYCYIVDVMCAALATNCRCKSIALINQLKLHKVQISIQNVYVYIFICFMSIL